MISLALNHKTGLLARLISSNRAFYVVDHPNEDHCYGSI